MADNNNLVPSSKVEQVLASLPQSFSWSELRSAIQAVYPTIPVLMQDVDALATEMERLGLIEEQVSLLTMLGVGDRTFKKT